LKPSKSARRSVGKTPRTAKSRADTIGRLRGFKARRTMLSHCVAKFALAASDPFHPGCVGVCLPVLPVIKSQKVSRFVRGTFVIGTNGAGYVGVNPCVNNDYYSIATTSAAYTGSGLSIRLTSTTGQPGVELAALNGPWGSANTAQSTGVIDSVTGRVVAAGLSVQYAGPLLNQGGVYTALVDPDHETVGPIPGAGFTASQLGQFRQAYVKPNCGQKVVLCAVPISGAEEAYQTTAAINAAGNVSGTATQYPYGFADVTPAYTPSGGVVGAFGDPNMVILVTGGTPGTVFYYEYILHCEYIGRPTAGVSTNGESDYVGYQKVAAAAQGLPEALSAKGASWGDRASEVMSFLIDNQTALIKTATTLSAMASGGPPGMDVPRLMRAGG